MRIWVRLGILVIALAIAAWIWWPRQDNSMAFRQGDMVVSTPWARATPGTSTIGAAYMGLTNRGTVPDRLIGAQTPVAERAEIHTTMSQDGMMQMRPVDSVALPPGQTVRFEPSGLHFMLVNLKAPLKEGSEFPLQITFEHAGTLTVQVTVGGVGASQPPQEEHAGHGR
jgi:copper(I)-binding protein